MLSVIAQQILNITQAVRSGLENFSFEGRELKLKPSCFICVTMNPENPGCFELPDNLKVFPNYTLSIFFFLLREVSISR